MSVYFLSKYSIAHYHYTIMFYNKLFQLAAEIDWFYTNVGEDQESDSYNEDMDSNESADK